MALTPDDVQNKLFTTVRLREGYDQTEVDEFLDEIEAELRRLLQENDSLRSGGATPAGGTAAAVAEGSTAAEAAAVSQPPQEIVVRTTGDVSAAAARVLEMAQRTADQYVGEARAEADALLANAKTAAEQLDTEARSKADAIDRETHERTADLERRLDEQRQATLDALQDEKRRLESEVETLRSFEREYRGRLRTFLQAQLEQLASADGGDTPLAPAGGPDTSHAAVSASDAVEEIEPENGTDAPVDELEPGESGTDGSAQSGRRRRGSQGTRDGSGGSDGAPRSALGRILEEEERNVDGRA